MIPTVQVTLQEFVERYNEERDGKPRPSIPKWSGWNGVLTYYSNRDKVIVQCPALRPSAKEYVQAFASVVVESGLWTAEEIERSELYLSEI